MATTRIQFADNLSASCLSILYDLCDIPLTGKLYSYQEEIAYRIFFSLIFGDAAEIAVEAARQSGKSESLACTMATSMVIMPKLAQIYFDDPVLLKFRHGFMGGVFGPIELQSDTIFSRVHERLTSDKAKSFLADPEIDDRVVTRNEELVLTNSRSFCRKQTAHPKAKIESKTYHLILIDEAQDADNEVVRKSIHPMSIATAGTIVKIGTATSHTSDFYEATKRTRLKKMNGKKNYFAFDWKRAAKENPFYRQAMKQEIQRIGEDSDEFAMSYKLVWLLDRGMFITDEQIEVLGDDEMPLVPYWTDSLIVMGIDVAAKHDSTVCTAMWVDWAHPDEFGLYDHRVLNWMELHGENWESQYRKILEFCDHYSIMRIGVDGQGMGGPVADRLQVLMPKIEVQALGMSPKEQSERWQHLMQLIQRQKLRWPAAPTARKMQPYRRFIQQLSEVEKEYKGGQIVVQAPKQRNAHDDYVDSLALACSLTQDLGQETEVQQWASNPFLSRSMGRR